MLVRHIFFVGFYPVVLAAAHLLKASTRHRRVFLTENFSITVRQVQAIAAIDRGPLVRRLERELDIDRATAEIAIFEYLAFLVIAATNPARMVAPTSKLCDEAWHAHILHTEAYDRDMRAIFGRPFHHRPSDDAEAVWLAKPQQRTELILNSFYRLAKWSGLSEARAVRNIPEDRPLSTAAILGIAVASGLDSFKVAASLYRPVRTRDREGNGSGWGGSFGDISCGSHSRDGHSCDGHACSGHSCGGHSCGGSSCGGSGCGGGH